MCTEKDDLRGPQAHWQKTAVCPSSSSPLRCPGTLPVRRSGPQRGGTIWYQLLSSRGAPVPSSLYSVKVTLARWTWAFPGWLAGCLARAGATHHASVVKGPVTLRQAGLLPLAVLQTACQRMDGGTFCEWAELVVMHFKEVFEWTVQLLVCSQRSLSAAPITLTPGRFEDIDMKITKWWLRPSRFTVGHTVTGSGRFSVHMETTMFIISGHSIISYLH